METIGMDRTQLRAWFAARKEARRDMQSPMPYIRKIAGKAHGMLSYRLRAEVVTGARQRKGA